jgi:hypothetical protein
MKTTFYLILFSLSFSILSAQKSNNIWYFGNKAGIDFNNPCNPVPLTDGLNIGGFEGTSTIADEVTGQLLFYTDGFRVYNKNHISMSNIVLCSNSASQTLILRQPQSSTLFYVITPELQGNGFNSNYGLRCATVDLSLNNGLGAITNNNSLFLLPSGVTEKLTAVRHSNGSDIWIITHAINTDQFNVFLLDANGINLTPVVSNAGSNHTFSFSGQGAIGEMKASPSGLKLALTVFGTGALELFDFNPTTGQITNPISLNSEPFSYGVSFSPNSRMLYAASEPFFRTVPSTVSKLYQFDVSSNNATTINNTKTIIYTCNVSTQFPNVDYLGSLQIAPDNKIYVGRSTQTPFVGVINNPNSAGLNCNYSHNGFFLNGGKSVVGLNNAMEIPKYAGCLVTSIKDAEIESGISVFPNPVKANGIVNFTITNAEINQLIIFDVCGRIILKKEIANESTIQLNTTNFKTGIYFYELRNETFRVKVGKLVVQ